MFDSFEGPIALRIISYALLVDLVFMLFGTAMPSFEKGSLLCLSWEATRVTDFLRR